MSEQESSSEDSSIRESGGTPMDPEKAEHPPERQENGDSENNQQGETPRMPRVRFRSNASFWQEAPRNPPPEDVRAEWDRSQRQGLPHRPTMPYSHETADITDTPLPERTDQADGTTAKEEKPADEKAPEEGKKPIYNPERWMPSSVRDRYNSATKSIKQRITTISNVLGRPAADGDDLRPGLYRPDWASGGEVPLSDVTDNKHKTDEEKRQHQGATSSEAHRLVRDLTQDHSAKRRKGRGRPYPQRGTEFSGGEDEGALESGLRYRSGGGGILSQLIKLNNPSQDQKGAAAPVCLEHQVSLPSIVLHRAAQRRPASGISPSGTRNQMLQRQLW